MPTHVPRMLGNANKYAILRTIRRCGPTSRADLARELGMSPPSISSNIAALLEAGLISEIGSGSADFGRKPILLEFNRTFRYACGIDIGETSARLAVADGVGEIVGSKEVGIRPERGAQAILALAAREVRELADGAGVDWGRMGAAAVSVPGIVDERTGELTLSTIIGKWEGLRIREFLEAELGIPAAVGNDVDMAILGEHGSGRGRGHDNLVYIKIGDGLAARIIIDGRLFHGVHDSAGEIGYMLLDQADERPAFRSRGALEQRICNDTIDREYRSARARAGLSRVPKAEMVTLARLLAMAEGGDAIASGILRSVVGNLSRTLVNVASVLDVDLVILGGDAEAFGEAQLSAVRKFMERHVPYVPAVVTSSLGGMAGIAGCVRRGVELLEDAMSSMW